MLQGLPCFRHWPWLLSASEEDWPRFLPAGRSYWPRVFPTGCGNRHQVLPTGGRDWPWVFGKGGHFMGMGQGLSVPCAPRLQRTRCQPRALPTGARFRGGHEGSCAPGDRRGNYCLRRRSLVLPTPVVGRSGSKPPRHGGDQTQRSNVIRYSLLSLTKVTFRSITAGGVHGR